MARGPVALDACALIAFLAGQAGAEVVEQVLARAAMNQGRVSIHRANLGEVYYLKLRAAGRKAADALLAELAKLPLEVADVFDERLMREAAGFKVRFGLLYLDAIAAGWASIAGASLMTTDHRGFAPLARAEALTILWAR